MDLALLSLFPATPEQVLESRCRTFELWGTGRSLEQYLERDVATEQSECGRGGKYITWVLAPRSDPQTLDFFCSCETFRRHGLVRSTSGIMDISCYGVASVFAPPRYRHKGYARHMLRLLHWVIASESYLPSSKFPVEWGSPPNRTLAGDASFSVLYSDVGSDFYRACGPLLDEDGWVVEKPLSTEWSVSESTDGVTSPQGTERKWILLDDKALVESWKADTRKIKEDLSTLSVNQTVFTFLPDQGVAEFQYQRSKGIWSQLDHVPIYWGVCSVTQDDANIVDEITSNDRVSFATWAFDYSSEGVQSLIITRLRSTRADFPELLRQIVKYAKSYGLPKVEIWNLAPELKEVALETCGRTISREEHLSAVKWYGPGNAEWILNEKFCWC